MIKVAEETKVRMGKRVYIKRINEIIGFDNMMEKIGMVLEGNEMPYETRRMENGSYAVVTYRKV